MNEVALDCGFELDESVVGSGVDGVVDSDEIVGVFGVVGSAGVFGVVGSAGVVEVVGSVGVVGAGALGFGVVGFGVVGTTGTDDSVVGAVDDGVNKVLSNDEP